MCLYLNKKNITPKYATKDKVVYRWLTVRDGRIESPFRGFVYNLGEVYTSPLVKSYEWHTFYDYGRLSPDIKFRHKLIIVPEYRFTRFSFDELYIARFMSAIAVTKDEIDLGFHSLDSVESALEYKKMHSGYAYTLLFECIIPKYSWYYENDFGEIASDQLIVVKAVC